MPTKHPRHAVTETPTVKAALDELRAELGGARPNLGELVVLGAELKVAELRQARDQRQAGLDRLAAKIRSGTFPRLDVDAADEVKRLRLPSR